ncbi:MBL fold metallo-hydrolase [Shewanella psychrotolerans]|uniref:MBL fold metallo-hydrolase n=1 Tax=Shewanella psychrotolerans TaxID=2864206 RepID=UPI001C654AD8|nr:MBL fold metallo-hydrolase [Shewanella psychrotolerans]QYK00088.1 MBL fold metallo-hydrolase [Shewanella psychrotolerans]
MTKLISAIPCVSLLGCCFLLGNSAFAADDRFANVEIVSQQLSPNTYMFTGSGGNIGVSAGQDGIIIIDNQFAPLAGKISAALNTIQPGLPRYVVNTHYHGDHTGGNNSFGPSSTIFAHSNVLKRLASNDKYTQAALPSITYEQGVSIHFNGDILHLIHLGAGHTDGDSVVLWDDKSVVHMGDLFFKDKWPYVDLEAGGSVKGYRDSVANIINRIGSDTKVIPGHGELATKNDLIRFKHILDESINWMEGQLITAKSLETLKQNGLPQNLQGWGWHFISDERWIETLYQDLSSKKP